MHFSKLFFGLFTLSSLLFSANPAPQISDYLIFAQEVPSDKMTFIEADAYCETLTLYGLGDWQLPNEKELNYFNNENENGSFWSSNKPACNIEKQALCVHPKPTPQHCFKFLQSEFTQTLKNKKDVIVEAGELLYNTKENHSIYLSFAQKNIPHTNENMDFFCEEKEENPSHIICSADEEGGEIETYFKKDSLFLRLKNVQMSKAIDEPIVHSISSKNKRFSQGFPSPCLTPIAPWNITLQRTNEDDLFNASTQGDVVAVLKALDKGANINATDNNGMTALAIGIDNINVVKLLLNYEASTELNHIMYDSLLDLAIEKGELQTVQLLIDSGMKPSLENIFSGIDDEGNFELEDLFALGNEETVELLLRNGADVNIKDERGYTPIYKVAMASDMLLLELFMHYHAKLDIVYENKQTLYNKVCNGSWEEACNLLKSRLKIPNK